MTERETRYFDRVGAAKTPVAYRPATNDGRAFFKLSCGHEPDFASHFSYRVGDDHRCFKCGPRCAVPVAVEEEASGAQTVRLDSDPTIRETGTEWCGKLSAGVA